MTIDRKKLRELAMAATPGKWIAGHLADDKHPCNCRHILADGYMGCVCEIAEPKNGLPLGEGGNDNPPLAEAKANLAYIAAVHPGAIIEMLDALEAAEKRIVSLQSYGPALWSAQ